MSTLFSRERVITVAGHSNILFNKLKYGDGISMQNELLIEANKLLQASNFEYAFCGGFAIELFLNRETRKHGDIDISAYWQDREKNISYMQSLGFHVYEMCGGGIAHHIIDVKFQIKSRRNI